jgi:hypothetical protein
MESASVPGKQLSHDQLGETVLVVVLMHGARRRPGVLEQVLRGASGLSHEQRVSARHRRWGEDKREK